jgi:hypothetical protein
MAKFKDCASLRSDRNLRSKSPCVERLKIKPSPRPRNSQAATDATSPPLMNPSGAEPRSGEAGRRALKANKACVPCRARKTKCDAAEIGLPCSSCTSRQCAKDCVLPVRKGRVR